jgi:hypothetical protein
MIQRKNLSIRRIMQESLKKIHLMRLGAIWVEKWHNQINS